MRDDVTVVITNYNYGRFLPEAVESARSQARVVVVDDGSTDAETLVALERLPEDVVCHRQENAGVAAARNAGLALAETPYVLCLDADDRLAPGSIEALAAAIERGGTGGLARGRAAEPQLGFAYGWMRFFGAWDWTWETPEYDAYKLLYRHQIGLSALMRRELVEATGGFDASFGEFEDWELWVNALEHGFRGVRVPRVVLEYRKHEANKQTTDRTRYRTMYRALRKKHAPLYARASELARQTHASPLDRLVYPYFWGARPIPARIEAALQARAWRSRD